MPHFVYAIAALAVIGICHLFTINVASGVMGVIVALGAAAYALHETASALDGFYRHDDTPVG